MALKSILTIDVNDRAFQKYLGSFKQYQALLAGHRVAWQQIQSNIKGTTKSFDEMVAKFAAHNVHAKLALTAQKEADRITRTTAERWRDMATSTRLVASNVVGIGTSLLRWTSITGIISGLLGAGGLFGIERLAANVAAGRRSARGLGITYGEQASFGINLGRFADESMLGNVMGGKFDMSSPAFAGLVMAGLSPDFIKTHDAAEISEALMRKAPGYFAQFPEGARGMILSQTPYGSVMDIHTLNRLMGMKPDEREDWFKRYEEGRTAFHLDPGVQEKWDKFVASLQRSGTVIENVFAKRLSELAPGLGHLGESIATVIDKFTGTRQLNDWLEQFGKKLEEWAAWLAKPENQDKIKKTIDDLITTLGEFAAKVAYVASWIPGGSKTPSGAPAESGTKGPGLPWVALQNYLRGNKTGHWTTADVAAAIGGGAGGVIGEGKLKGVDPELAARILRMEAAVPAAYGPVGISSGFRTAAEQEMLRQHNPSGYPVAKGTSMHERGLAVDVKGNAAALAWMHEHASEYGITFPVKNDPVHAQMSYPPQATTVHVFDATGSGVTTQIGQSAAVALPGGGLP